MLHRRARAIDLVPVNVRDAEIVVRGAPDFVAAREGNRETRSPRSPGNCRTATVPNLYRSFKRSIGIVDLPNVNAVVSHLSKQPDGSVRSSHDLPDRRMILWNPENSKSRKTRTLKRR